MSPSPAFAPRLSHASQARSPRSRAVDVGESTQALLAKLTQIERDFSLTHVDRSPLPSADEYTRTEVLPPHVLVPHGVQGRRWAQVGDVINGRFVLEKEIGRGGMGRVFKALDKRRVEAHSATPHVAVKVMSVPGVDLEAATVAMDREVQRSQALSHPHIVRVNDFDRDGSTVFATMELLEGASLRARLDGAGPGGLAPAHARRIIRQCAEALAHAHGNGILHADFKPSNVFVTVDGAVKVIDFGIARAYRPGACSPDEALLDAALPSGFTPAYASPEMLELRAPDPRDDVYALGCVAYETLTGRHPFDRLPANQARDLRRRPVRPARVSRREWAALQGALRFDRASRTVCVKAFLAAFGAGAPRRERPEPSRSARAALVSTAALLGSLFWLPSTPASGDVAGLSSVLQVAQQCATDLSDAGPCPAPPPTPGRSAP